MTWMTSLTGRLLTVGILMTLTAGSLQRWEAGDFVPDGPPLRALPAELSEWRGQESRRLDRETEEVLKADDYLLRTYTNGALPVTLFVAFYASQRSGRTTHSPLNCLPGTGWEWIDRGRETVAVDSGRTMEINRGIARRRADRTLVYYWYQSRGRVVADEYRNKLLLVRDALTLHRSDGALVRVTAAGLPGDRRMADAARSFVRIIYPTLTRYLPE